jgi:hypothetical protein
VARHNDDLTSLDALEILGQPRLDVPNVDHFHDMILAWIRSSCRATACLADRDRRDRLPSRAASVSEQTALGEAHVAAVADDDVVVDREAEEAGPLDELAGEVDVLLGRRRVT